MINDATKDLLDQMCYACDDAREVIMAVGYLHDCLTASGATDISYKNTMVAYVIDQW